MNKYINVDIYKSTRKKTNTFLDTYLTLMIAKQFYICIYIYYDRHHVYEIRATMNTKDSYVYLYFIIYFPCSRF